MNNNEVNVQKRTITPEIANKLLGQNNGNRKLSYRNVQFLYSQMASGNWMLTADTIKIGSNGRLMDGQHRLQALLKYGKPLEMFVAEGLDDNVMPVLDTGKNRTAGDVLSMNGFKSSNNIAGAVRVILLFNQGVYAVDKAGKISKATNASILKFTEENPEIHEVMTYVNGIYRQFRFMTQSNLAMLYWVLSKKNATQCDIFFEKYATGIELGVTSPIRHLRERLLKNSVNKSKLSTRDKIALFIYAWNAFRDGKKMQQLTLQKNYNFPKPI